MKIFTSKFLSQGSTEQDNLSKYVWKFQLSGNIKKNINFTTESDKTKIPQFRAQLDIKPKIMTSRQVSPKMFLVLTF